MQGFLALGGRVEGHQGTPKTEELLLARAEQNALMLRGPLFLDDEVGVVQEALIELGLHGRWRQ